jgi:50S ribosomal subunit-associated GTPase HflX
MLPRLTGMWTHLERQRGGTGTRGGAGEKEIETDRRIVRDKIALLKERLKEIDKQMARINADENHELLELVYLFYDFCLYRR